MSKMISFVSFDMFKRWCVENGIPGAEAYTTDFLVFSGSVAGGAVNGAFTQPTDVKLSDEYDYYLSEIRASASFLDGVVAAIGAQAYVPTVEAQHIAFTLNSDGRNRPSMFRGGAIPIKQILGGWSFPLDFPAPCAFAGREKVQCVMSHNGTYNPQAIAAAVDFTITVTCVLIKGAVLDEYDRYLQSLGQKTPQRVR